MQILTHSVLNKLVFMNVVSYMFTMCVPVLFVTVLQYKVKQMQWSLYFHFSYLRSLGESYSE